MIEEGRKGGSTKYAEISFLLSWIWRISMYKTMSVRVLPMDIILSQQPAVWMLIIDFGAAEWRGRRMSKIWFVLLQLMLKVTFYLTYQHLIISSHHHQYCFHQSNCESWWFIQHFNSKEISATSFIPFLFFTFF